MTIEIDRAVLKEILAAVTPASPRSSRRHLEHEMRLRARGALLTATCDNGDLQIEATGPLHVDDADLDVTVSRKQLRAAVLRGDTTVHLELEGTGRRARLTVRPTRDIRIGLDTHDLVPQPDHPGDVPLGCELTPDDVRDLATIARSCSTDETRPILTGVGVDEHGTWGATDAYRAAWLPLPDTADTLAGWIVPADLIGVVSSWRDPDPVVVTVVDHPWGAPAVQVTGTRVRADRPVQVVARAALIDGTFPNLAKLIVDESNYDVTVDAHELIERLDVIRSVGRAVLGSGSPGPVTLTPADTGDHIRLSTYGQIDVTATVAVKDADGDPCTIAFAPRFLTTAIDQVVAGDDPTVTIRLRDGLKPGFLTGASRVRTMLMPMRVG